MLYLASKSPRRRELIQKLNIPFEVISADADETLPEGIEFYDESKSAIRLSSLPIGSEPGLCDLPEDTWLCLRSPISLANFFKPQKAEAEHAEYQAYLRAVISYKKETE